MSNPGEESEITPEKTGAGRGTNPATDEISTFSIDANDNYCESDPAHIVLKGKADSYNQNFIIFLHLNPREDHCSLEQLSAVAGVESTVLNQVDLSRTATEIKAEIANIKQNLSDSATRDTHNFENKLTRVLKQPNRLETLCQPLLEGKTDPFRSDFKTLFREEIFPGSHLECALRVISPEQQDRDESVENLDEHRDDTAGEDESENQSAGPEVFEVVPELDPFDGVRLDNLSPGDTLYVRICGDSVEDIQQDYHDENNSGEMAQSKRLSSPLVTVKESPKAGVKTFLVLLDPEVLGQFSLDPATKVEVRDYSQLSFYVKLKRRVYFSLIVFFIFLFSASVLVFVFPETVLELLFYLN